MEELDIPVERAESLLETANKSFRAQKALENEGGQPDYSRAARLSKQVIKLKNTSVAVKDELRALSIRIEGLEDRNLELSQVNQAYSKANQSFYNQRFEESEDQIEIVYTEISRAKSARTRVEAFAEAQRQTVTSQVNLAADLVRDNWRKASVSTVLGFILGFAVFRRLRTRRFKKKKKQLERKYDTVQEMMENAQYNYFVDGESPKISFESRMQHFKELSRNTEERIRTLRTRVEKREGFPAPTEELKKQIEED